MTYEDLSAEKLVKKLELAGKYPEPELIEAIWERRAETEPLLLTVFDESFADDWPDDKDPRWFRLAHAGKFMLSWQNLEALPIFGRFYGTDEKDIEDMLEWFEEDLFHYGPAAVPYLKDAVLGFTKAGNDEWSYGLGLSGSILTKIALHYPETRDDITAFFSSLLPALEDIPSLEGYNGVWADIAGELGALADEGSREVVLALNEANLIQGGFFSLKYYLQAMNKGYQPEQPPEPFDLRAEYRDAYEDHQEELVRKEREKREERENRVRQAAVRSGPKIGRNDPCPCGSGRKYKHCHGRPGA